MLKVKTILVSQPTPVAVDKSPYHDIFINHDVSVEYRPFIKVEAVSIKEYRAQRTEVLDHTAIIFTSRTTVDHFFRMCDETRVVIPETMKYLCNTETVALYLQKYIVYRKRRVFFANGTFPDFMELILKHKKEKMMLVLSEPYKPELALTMHKLKLNFSKAILSRTVSTDLSDLKVGDYDILVFFSPSEIASLVTQFGSKDLPLIATFGEGTTRAAIEAGLRVSVTAPTPEAPSMAKAVDIFISKINSGETISPIEFNLGRQAEEFLKAQQAKPQRKRTPHKATSVGAAKSKINSSANGKAKTSAPKAVAEKIVPPSQKTAMATVNIKH